MTTAGNVAQVQTFVGYETTIHDAVNSAQKQANMWLGYHKMPVETISVSAQTIAEITPSHDQVFYIHVITVLYPHSRQ